MNEEEQEAKVLLLNHIQNHKGRKVAGCPFCESDWPASSKPQKV